ncbi:Lysosomal Pro-X carboxypeptidase [Chionoecetes opilio]|uniref:Lysosomal Pro-X carboxypeptidase n=1 Tax=Chionoecetes opilio TaxID=41210 RepID=A0A8J5CUA0_CHIOP|nr:Lysosomal Pro-X carboxypeptidase [Chionoecetes opilio]
MGASTFLRACLLCLVLSCHAYKYKTYFTRQRVDHFSFANQDTFLQRFLINDDHWDSNGGPIFFYAGNEGDITLFAENTGFMWDIAAEFRALLVFGEHRYYGVSEPYGNKSLTTPKYSGYLTSEQALADYVDLVSYLRFVIEELKPVLYMSLEGLMEGCWPPGSASSTLTSAIAASAPVRQFTDFTPCDKFGQKVTEDFAKASEACVEVIRKSWAAIDAVTAKEDGMAWLSKTWNLCKPLKDKGEVEAMKGYLMDTWTNLAMVDYPYPANFLAPLPAYPIEVVCSHLTEPGREGKALLEELFEGVTVYFNYTGQSKCLDYTEEADARLDDRGWSFQSCTEMVMPFCYDGVKDFFEPAPWDFQEVVANCRKTWGVTPRAYMAPLMYGGWTFNAASNIVFSNGLLDPWSTGGVLWNVSDSVVAVIIPEGAHHLDLRSANPADPPSVVEARRVEKAHITKWIEQFKQMQGAG